MSFSVRAEISFEIISLVLADDLHQSTDGYVTDVVVSHFGTTPRVSARGSHWSRTCWDANVSIAYFLPSMKQYPESTTYSFSPRPLGIPPPRSLKPVQLSESATPFAEAG